MGNSAPQVKKEFGMDWNLDDGYWKYFRSKMAAQQVKLTGDAESPSLFKRISGFQDLANIEYNHGASTTRLIFTPEDPDEQK
jgi:hypothetical protein